MEQGRTWSGTVPLILRLLALRSSGRITLTTFAHFSHSSLHSLTSSLLLLKHNAWLGCVRLFLAEAQRGRASEAERGPRGRRQKNVMRTLGKGPQGISAKFDRAKRGNVRKILYFVHYVHYIRLTLPHSFILHSFARFGSFRSLRSLFLTLIKGYRSLTLAL